MEEKGLCHDHPPQRVLSFPLSFRKHMNPLAKTKAKSFIYISSVYHVKRNVNTKSLTFIALTNIINPRRLGPGLMMVRENFMDLVFLESRVHAQ